MAATDQGAQHRRGITSRVSIDFSLFFLSPSKGGGKGQEKRTTVLFDFTCFAVLASDRERRSAFNQIALRARRVAGMTDFLSEQETLMRDTARKFAQEVVAPTAAERDRTSSWPRNELKAAAALGFLGIRVPEEFGGANASFVENILVLEELAAADAGFATIVHVHSGMCSRMVEHGSRQQQEKYVRGLVSGELIGAGLLTEPHAGSDTAAFRTTARRDGNHYVLNGSKQFISNEAKRA